MEDNNLHIFILEVTIHDFFGDLKDYTLFITGRETLDKEVDEYNRLCTDCVRLRAYSTKEMRDGVYVKHSLITDIKK